MPHSRKSIAWKLSCIFFWDSFWDPKIFVWQFALQDISKDSGCVWKLQATVSWFQELIACWNYTELLIYISRVARIWYKLFCTVYCQASFLGSQEPSQKWCLTMVRNLFLDCQAYCLGLWGIIYFGSSGFTFWIVRHFFFLFSHFFWRWILRCMRKKKIQLISPFKLPTIILFHRWS